MFLQYEAIHDYLILHSEITPDEAKNIINNLADKKKIRRYFFKNIKN